MTRDAAFKRRVRARMARTGERYAAARAQVDDRTTDEPAAQAGDTTHVQHLLHVTNGDCAAEVMRAAGLTEPILPWRDVLHDGPVPVGLTDAELRAVRADFIAGGGLDPAAVRADFDARDATLAAVAARHEGRVVLWFEADLYDQLQVVQVLDRLHRAGVPPESVSLVSAGEFPGVAHFGGLGELAPADLLRLRGDELPLTAEAYELAVAAWAAFTAPDPAGLAGIAQSSSPVLRHLAEAFGRLAQEYPARSDGLSLTQRRILLAVEGGAGTAGAVFAEVRRRERRPYLGDTSCHDRIAELAGARQPLLAVSPGATDDGPYADREVVLTATGREVLAGRADHAELNGVDRWIGGVHLTGTRPAWRYDERLEALQPG
ncbi:hypothetical protein SAMN05421678_105300 [Actinopolymorpha cephalotaxi]|uniref:DUF1835 domain-containing protein n=1 Tax=Actinopolymorpha cephalotaxi TaxID=504797 RepID=A0A1I2RA94_9ACTN|nr:hypothetical protein [Actinopolymorpha cephalotaxi]NYH82296.1 hypothetical protein [Actinopolymorpha cephalotaxi]SFG37614.1 hypothetical protein SAMN05421678_105300 [Actinopolymorpha cephalotaxi]